MVSKAERHRLNDIFSIFTQASKCTCALSPVSHDESKTRVAGNAKLKRASVPAAKTQDLIAGSSEKTEKSESSELDPGVRPSAELYLVADKAEAEKYLDTDEDNQVKIKIDDVAISNSKDDDQHPKMRCCTPPPLNVFSPLSSPLGRVPATPPPSPASGYSYSSAFFGDRCLGGGRSIGSRIAELGSASSTACSGAVLSAAIAARIIFAAAVTAAVTAAAATVVGADVVSAGLGGGVPAATAAAAAAVAASAAVISAAAAGAASGMSDVVRTIQLRSILCKSGSSSSSLGAQHVRPPRHVTFKDTDGDKAAKSESRMASGRGMRAAAGMLRRGSSSCGMRMASISLQSSCQMQLTHKPKEKRHYLNRRPGQLATVMAANMVPASAAWGSSSSSSLKLVFLPSQQDRMVRQLLIEEEAQASSGGGGSATRSRGWRRRGSGYEKHDGDCDDVEFTAAV